MTTPTTLPDSPSAAMLSLRDWTPEDAPLLDIPGLDVLCGGAGAAAWIREEHARVARHPADGFEALSVAGTVGRLWSPRGADVGPAEALRRLMADDDPAAHARRWVVSLPEAVLRTAEELALVATSALADAIADAAETTPDEPDEALCLAEQRDQLESVRVALRWAGRGTSLSAALERADRAAAVRCTWFRYCAERVAPSSGRLRAVAWQEPNAWWGHALP